MPFCHFLDRSLRQKRVALTILTQRQQKYCTWAEIERVTHCQNEQTSPSAILDAQRAHTRQKPLFLKTFSRFATRRINDVTKQKMRAFFRVNDLETKSARDSWDLGSLPRKITFTSAFFTLSSLSLPINQTM
ncbi:hypothetical protein CEXT_565211 [Caerostris extrusa]|uniref:Uncharacterized protein n=1 Tax=Caerostris extrusa TaxID=172846 RepID=A0AAV4N4Q6_CAEEX|nr:hypothetical protein CEXT_565211 [Caerostris extrusa]